MSAAKNLGSANTTSRPELAILEPQALGAWMPELKLELDEERSFYHAPLLDRDIVDDLERALDPHTGIKDEHLGDATRLSLARWARVHCAQQSRCEAALAGLRDPSIAASHSEPDNELWDRSKDLLALRAQCEDASRSLRQRCWAAIELGLLQQECGHPIEDALESFMCALKFIPAHLVALELAWRCAAANQDKDLARDLLGQRLSLAKSLKLPEDPGLRRCMGALWSKADEVREHLDHIHELSPNDIQVAHRRIAWAFMDGQFDRLSDLFWTLAGQEDGNRELRISALHMCMLTAPTQDPTDPDLVSAVLSAFVQASDEDDHVAVGAIAMMRELADCCGPQLLENDPPHQKRLRHALGVLAEKIDDPRDQALIHEQLARMNLRALRNDARSVLTASEIAPVLHNLQVCSDLLPDLRWNREATAEVLARVQNYPALAQHFESWASDCTHSKERASLLLRAGRVYEYDLGEYALALECYRQAHAEQPRNPECLRSLGGCYARCGQWNDAASVLQQQIEQSTDPFEREHSLRRLVNIARYEIQDADLALASLQQIIEQRPDDLGSLYLTASIARREDRMGVLVDALERLLGLTKDPTSQSVLASELAFVLDHRLDRHEEAIQWHTHALCANSAYAPSRRELTRLHLAQGEDQDALALLMDEDPEEMGPERLFPALLIAQRLPASHPLRLEIYTAAADQLSPSPALHTESARMLMDAEDYRRAYTLLERLPESSFAPLAAEQHYELGRASHGLETHDSEHASHWKQTTMRHWHRCLELEPAHYAALDGLYQVYTRLGDLQGLDQLYEKVAEHLDPVSRVQILAHRARMACLDPERKDNARALYEQALMLRPGDGVLRFELEQVLRSKSSARALFNNLVRQAGEISDPTLKSALAIAAAETLLDASSGAELKTVGRLVLSALKSDPGNPHAVALLEHVLNLDPSVVPVRAAVSARAVRAQSDEERAVFFAESAELLERGNFFRDAKVAYQAAQELVVGTGVLEESIDRMQRAMQGAGAQRDPNQPPRRPSGSQVSTDQQLAVQRAIEEDNEELAARIVAQITTQLAHDPDQPDAIYLLVQLASAHLQRAVILRSLAQLFVRLTKRGCRYRAGVLLGIHSEDPAQGASYLNAALIAKPDGLSAREALLGRYREMGQLQKQAETIRALLAHPRFAEARKPALQRELVLLLANDDSASAEALQHCAELLREHTRDATLIQLYSQLLEKQERFIDAAHALEPLLIEQPSTALVHAVRLRQAQLYARRMDTFDAAMTAVQTAITAAPDHADTLELFLALCEQTGRAQELDPHIEPIRIATVSRITLGNTTLKDLDNLSRLLSSRQHPAKRRVQVLHEALAPQTLSPKSLQGAGRLNGPLFRDPESRIRSRSSQESSDLMELLALLDPHMLEFTSTIDELNPAHVVPLPLEAVASQLGALVHSLADAMKVEAPVLTACSSSGVVAWISKSTPELRITRRLWASGDLEVGVGALYLAAARYLNGGSMIRTLSARNMDLVLAAAFDLAGVFHPLTAEPEANALEQMKQALGQKLKGGPLRALQRKCIAMQELDLAPGSAKEACLKSDLRLAVLLSKDPRTVLLTAAALDDQHFGTPIERICQSPIASALLGDFLSDDAMNRDAKR